MIESGKMAKDIYQERPLGAEGEGDESSAHFWRRGIVQLPDGYWACPYTGNSVIHDHPADQVTTLFPKRRPLQNLWARWRPHDELHLNYRCEPGG